MATASQATASNATGSMGLNGARAASPSTEILDPFEPDCILTIKNSDQYQLEEQMSAMDHDGIKMILNGNKSFRIEGDWVNVEKAYEQWEALRNKKLASKTEENKEQISDNCDAVKRKERNRVLKKDLTPSVKQVDVSLSQKVPIDQHVWYYLEHKHPNKVTEIATKHLCISRFVCETLNEGITHSLEVVPYFREDSEEAKKHVDDAVEEFAELYQRVSEPGIVKESIELPLVLNKGLPQQLIAELEEAGVFFLRSDAPCLVGPQACIEGAQQKVSDFIRRHNNSPTQTQPDDNIGEAQSSAAERFQPLNFKTPHGLTVHVSQGDLVHQSLDAIVNPANENLGHGGGAARAIAKAAGYALQRESKDFIWHNGKLGITHVMHTSAGNLQPRIQYVIHTVGPRNTDAKDDKGLFDLVKSAIFNCLLYANDELKIHSIAIPAISSGIFGVSIEIVGRASFEALRMFDNHYATSKGKSLHEIHFLNKDTPTFENMKRIFQSLMKDFTESSVDPEDLGINAMEYFDGYAKAYNRQIIEIKPHDNCFTRAFATALERDFHSEFDWRKVEDMIKKELDNNKDYYKLFRASKESDKQWSFADVVKNPKGAIDAVANFLSAGNKGVDPDVWLDAAANALNVQIVLVQLSETQVPVERNVKPRSNKDDRTVYIAYHYCGHHHFDAVVKKSGSEDTVSVKEVLISVEETPAGTNNNWLASGRSHNGLSHTSNIGGSFEEINEDELRGMPPEMASGVVEKKAAKEKASDVAGKEAANKGDDAKRDDDDNHCIICMDEITDKKELPCKHKFCRECIDQYFSKGQPKCPSCGKVFGMLRGDQPKGTMTTQENNWQHLPGYHNCGTIEINYSFGNGTQGDNHPNPGQPYRGTHRTAYLPANKEGREVLHLLKRAFDAGLVFTIGQSNTTGQNNVVIWNDVHHKTSLNGQYGYPDATYLKRVKEELAAKGIQ